MGTLVREERGSVLYLDIVQTIESAILEFIENDKRKTLEERDQLLLLAKNQWSDDGTPAKSPTIDASSINEM